MDRTGQQQTLLDGGSVGDSFDDRMGRTMRLWFGRPEGAPPAMAHPRGKISPDIGRANRVTERCLVDPDTGCWNWTGALSKRGYGRVRVLGRLRLPHRVVALAAGLVDSLDVRRPDQNILHSCDNGRCCNPDHMEAGTMSKNMKDCVARGRHKRAAKRAHTTLEAPCS